jgi:aspartate/glutamate racemase
MNKRIVIIHATPVAINPIQKAFRQDWPEAELVNILDDSLSPDLESAGSQTPDIIERIVALARYGSDIGASGILYSCSAFSDAINAAKSALALPVLKPNEAMFDEAMEAGSRIGLLATFGPSVPSMEKEFRDLAEKQGKTIYLESLLVEEAMTALRAGDAETHNRLLAEFAPRLGDCDAVMLAHFSTSRALADVSHVLNSKVLTSPHSAVARLKSVLT